MTRPISILCLADIHYNPKGDMSALDNLGKELQAFVAKVENVRWEPDYIVIAGDLADKGKGLKEAKCFIDSLSLIHI